MADPAKRGIVRVKMGFIAEHSVRMMFEPYGPLEISETHYKDQGYEPPFEELPWLENYLEPAEGRLEVNVKAQAKPDVTETASSPSGAGELPQEEMRSGE